MGNILEGDMPRRPGTSRAVNLPYHRSFIYRDSNTLPKSKKITQYLLIAVRACPPAGSGCLNAAKKVGGVHSSTNLPDAVSLDSHQSSFLHYFPSDFTARQARPRHGVH